MLSKFSMLQKLSISKWIYLNYLWGGNKGVDLRPLRGSYFELSKSFKISGDGKLVLNADRYKNGKMFTYLNADENTELVIHGHCFLCYGCDIKLFSGAKLEMNDCSVNSYSQIRCMNHISIGKNTRISRNVQIWDGDYHKICGAKNEKSEVIIEDNVWVGAGAIILKGVHIGEGAMVAAGAVVTKDIPQHCVAAGVPAKVIRENFKWEF